MAEQLHNSAEPDPLLAQLDAMLVVAQNNPRGNAAWFERANVTGTPTFTVWEYSHLIESSGSLYERARYHHRSWNSANPFLMQDAIFVKGSLESPAPASKDWHPKSLTVPNLTASFLREAKTPQQMGVIMNTYIDWAQTNAEPHYGGTHNVAAVLINHTMLDHRTLLTDPESPVMQSLKRLQPDAANRELARHFGMALGKVLRGKPLRSIVMSLPEHPILNFQPLFLETLVQLDEIGMIDKQFWFAFGVQSGAVFSVPDMLGLTLEGLRDPAGRAMLAGQRVADVRSTIRMHINRLFNHYIGDPNRDDSKIATLREKITNPLGELMLDRFVVYANEAVKAVNKNYTAAGESPDNLLPTLDVNNWTRHIGEALVRLMTLLRSPNLPGEVVAQQTEEDAMHASLIEIIEANLRDSYSLPDMRLRYPGATKVEIEKMMGYLRDGQNPADVDSWFRAKRRGQGKAKGWSAKRPGYGVLS